MKDIEIDGKSWKPHKAWLIRGKTFSVEVKLHTASSSFDWDSDGEFRWCVYAYVFQKHPIFSTFENDHIYQTATESIPLHGGCSYLRRSPDVVKVGCDYNHLYDEDFTYMKDPDDAHIVFSDAGALFDWLEAKELEGDTK